MIEHTIKRSPVVLAPVYYESRLEQREAIRLWAQSWAARLDGLLQSSVKAPAMVGRR